jgi:hypothetical protein
LAALPPRRRVIVDCWRVIDRMQLNAMTEIVHVGAGSAVDRQVTETSTVFQNDER